MGKIRVKTLGEEELEKKQQEEAQKRREAKKLKKVSTDTADSVANTQPEEAANDKEQKKEKKDTTKKVSSIKTKTRGKKYQKAAEFVDKTKKYTISEALVLIKKMAYASFDETVELHLNLTETGIKGEVALPHGTGKQVKVVIADDALLKKIDDGVIEFDVLVATASFMPKLVKYARVLGPKGLMPNPKNGTVVDDPQKAVEKFSTGAVRFKSEAKFPLLHMGVGKISFAEKDLAENINAIVDAVKKKNISQAFVSSTMTPSLEIVLQ